MTLREDELLDVVVIGGGPGGLAAGSRAASRGLAHVVLERGALANTISLYQKGKFVMDEPPALALREELALDFKAGSREAILDAWQRGTEAVGTNLLCGPQYEVVTIEGEAGDFRLSLKNGQKIRGRSLVLAIGLQGNLRKFEVPGAEREHVTYQLDDPAEHQGKHVLVVGVGDAGIENALALSENNSVGIVNRREEFARAKPRNRALIEAAIKQGKIQHHTQASVREIGDSEVVLETPDGALPVSCNLLIGRLGAIPPRKFLEGLGVEFPSNDPAAVPQVSERYETNVPGIYLIGAIAGYPLIKHCMNQGWEVVEHIVGEPVTPADEALLAAKFVGLDRGVDDVLEWIQSTIALLDGVTRIQLREFLVESTIHRPGDGEVIYERNDFSTSVYAILAGSVEVIAPASDSDSDTTYGDANDANALRFPIPTGQFFGEMSLLSGRRRSATVVARRDAILIEIPRLAMIKLMNSVKRVRRVIDEVFILRKLQTSLAPETPVADLQNLAASAVIETFRQGDVLFSEGDPSDGLHLIRRGSVTVSRKRAGDTQVLAYLPAGNIVGEMALFAPEGLRSATVTSTIFTETIRIPADDIATFADAHPELRRELKTLEGQRLVANAKRSEEHRSSKLVDFLVNAGAGEATDILLIDEALCVRCDNCETACAETHGGVSRLDREAGPTFGTSHIPTSCRHCENPKCMTDCPPDALRRHPNGEVYILDNCIGCGNCAANCPYGVIQMAKVDKRKPRSALWRLLFGDRRAVVDPAPTQEEGAPPADPKLAVKCDLCMKLPARRGGLARAACVASCPTGAILRVNPKAYIDKLLEKEG
ncbi:MAG: thioredoxin reductase/CRP-like cAMP-binding protein/Pyruvate [Hyphomicrobiaceae bacterium]|jgi:thioredoxin reductase/CRP-like cAMP-binding protein/Pyruvate/2-oxoacid:ferredoxin oxidoreductase delta subunit